MPDEAGKREKPAAALARNLNKTDKKQRRANGVNVRIRYVEQHYVSGSALATFDPKRIGPAIVTRLEEIVERAIEYTNRLLEFMPHYRKTAIEGLQKLRANLAAQAPDDPAIKKLDDYLDTLIAGSPP